MAVIQAGDPVLRWIADEVTTEQLGTDSLGRLIEDLQLNLAEKPGVGIAAPQIGVAMRVVLVQDPDAFQAGIDPERLAELERAPVLQYALINPELELVGEQTRTFFEGCLSVDGYRALVRRHHRVRVRYLDLEGNRHDDVVSGWHARILQHEVDHLNGILYVDRMLARTFMTTGHYEHWAHEPTEVVCQAFGA